MSRRVVVTGLGLICAVGNTSAETWSNLLAGKSGVATITGFDTSGFACTIAAEVKNFDPLNFIEKKEVKKMGRFIHLCMAATDEAVRMSGLNVTPEISERVGVNVYPDDELSAIGYAGEGVLQLAASFGQHPFYRFRVAKQRPHRERDHGAVVGCPGRDGSRAQRAAGSPGRPCGLDPGAAAACGAQSVQADQALSRSGSKAARRLGIAS